MICISYDKNNTECSLDVILSITWWSHDTIYIYFHNRQNFEPAISGLLGSAAKCKVEYAIEQRDSSSYTLYFLDVEQGMTGGRLATGWHRLAKRCYHIFLNNYSALAQGKLTEVSLKVFHLCTLKSLSILTKQGKRMDNLKEKFYMHKITSFLFINSEKCLISLKPQQLCH